jgi:uracil phosphoribosyltransferase
MRDLAPTARATHKGLYREPQPFVAVIYFLKSPSDLGERLVIVSSVLATGNITTAAIDRFKKRRAKDIRMAWMIAASEGVERVRAPAPGRATCPTKMRWLGSQALRRQIRN